MKICNTLFGWCSDVAYYWGCRRLCLSFSWADIGQYHYIYLGRQQYYYILLGWQKQILRVLGIKIRNTLLGWCSDVAYYWGCRRLCLSFSWGDSNIITFSWGDSNVITHYWGGRRRKNKYFGWWGQSAHALSWIWNNGYIMHTVTTVGVTMMAQWCGTDKRTNMRFNQKENKGPTY